MIDRDAATAANIPPMCTQTARYYTGKSLVVVDRLSRAYLPQYSTDDSVEQEIVCKHAAVPLHFWWMLQAIQSTKQNGVLKAIKQFVLLVDHIRWNNCHRWLPTRWGMSYVCKTAFRVLRADIRRQIHASHHRIEAYLRWTCVSTSQAWMSNSESVHGTVWGV